MNTVMRITAERALTVPRVIKIDPGESVVVEAREEGAGRGVPFVEEVRLPMETAETKNWYEATRRYGPYNYHPERCEDYNLETGGKTDLGEGLVAPFAGIVLMAGDLGGRTGKVVQLLGLWPDRSMCVWAGWHLQHVYPVSGQVVSVGEPIGTVGDADGFYAGSHLHTQVCVIDGAGIPTPGTFASNSRYRWRCPSRWFVEMGVDPELMRRCTEWDSTKRAEAKSTETAHDRNARMRWY